MKGSVAKDFLVTICIVFLSLAALMAFTIYFSYSKSVGKVEQIGETNLKSESAQIENYLNKGMDVLWVTADTVNNMIENNATSEAILQYLVAEADHQKAQVDENFTGVYGYINGEYLDGIGWEPPAGYVPTEREWYLAAKEAGGKPTIVAPYLDAQTNTIMISFSQLLSDGKSVVSLDVALNEIQNITERISVDDTGYGFIIDSTGLVVAHFNAEEKGKVYPLNEEQKKLLTQVYDGAGKHFEMYIDGEKSIVFSDQVLGDWYVVMLLNKDKLFYELRMQVIINIIISIIVFAAVVILCWISYRKVVAHQKRDDESKRILDRLNANTIKALAYTIDAKDRYTSGHSQRVANYSLELAKRMGKDEAEQQIIYNAGLLHDVGKIRVPEEVINKPGKLDDNEFNMIKMHPVSGFHILKDIYEDRRIASGAKYHHERYDGNGYPSGLAGDNIPEIARIIGVADAYDAMASNRSYRKALPQEVVRSEIEKGKGKQFDPEIADIMLQMIDEDKEYAMCQKDLPTKNILIVDDEIMNINIAKFILKDEPNYQVFSTQKATEALELLAQHPMDLILLDVYMPEMNGFDLYAKIREQYDVPVVLMTADKSMETLQKTIDLGMNDYITKPFVPVILKETVHGVVNSWS